MDPNLPSTLGFLAERLAAASAVPADQRTADVRAFIECCQLKTELTEELGLPEAIPDSRIIVALQSRWTAAAALRLVRSHFVSYSHPLQHCPQLHHFASNMLLLHSSSPRTGITPLDLGQEWTEIVERKPCLLTLAVLAAGLPTLNRDHGWERGLVRMSNRVVALMQRPAVRRALRAELAALPEALLSYEELLAFFVDYGCIEAASLMTASLFGGSSGRSPTQTPVDLAELWTASQHAMELLPQLAPRNPRLRWRAATLVKGISLTFPTTMAAAIEVARQQGSDYYVAMCGYEAAAAMDLWTDEAAARPGVPPPSAVLGWLQQAEAARRRCKRLLPSQWTRELDLFKATIAPLRAGLQQEGDRWRRLAPGERRELDAAWSAHVESRNDAAGLHTSLMCSACGKAAAQLRLCSACREAQYCSTECQRAHWKEHKARCKEAQAARAAAPAAAASGSGSASG